MLDIHMFSSATKVKGQGVGSAYLELIRLLEEHHADSMKVSINKFGKADISHYHTIDPLFYLSTIRPGHGTRIGYVHFLPETLEGSLKIPQPFRSIFYHYVIAFYKKMDAIVVVNPSFIPKLSAYGISEDKITYIPNFVSSSEFYEMETSEKMLLRKKLKISEEDFVVVGVGQLQERKGVFDFIELAKRHPEIKFIWVGGFSFGKMTDGYEELKKVVENPPDNLCFPGIVDRNQMNRYYNMADLFLLPSFNELFPMSVLEACSTNTPVMLRDLSLYHSIIAGKYEPCKDLSEMDEKLTVLVSSPKRIAELKGFARDVSKEYSEERLASIWQRYYECQARKSSK